MSQTGANRNIEDIYPLSPMQHGMLFHSLYAPERGEYINQMAWTIRGNLEVAAFEQTWQRVLDRHAILRTSFFWDTLDEPLQIVSRRVALPLEQRDWRGLGADAQRARLESLLREEREAGFALDKPPLMRLILVRSGADTYRFVWTVHHLLLDGWSMPLLFKEVCAFYDAFCRGASVDLPRSRPFRDYIGWLQNQDAARAENFWRATLKGFTAPTPLPFERAAKAGEDEAGDKGQGTCRLEFPPEATRAVQSFARRHQLTVNTLVQGAWAILLSRYSGERDVVFGSIVSGRPAELSGAEAMIGNFINTLPARVRVEEDEAVLDWLRRLQAAQAEARQYEYSPLVEVQGWSEVPRGERLFESLLAFQNYPLDESIRQQKSSLEFSDFRASERTNYPLTVRAAMGQRMQVEAFHDRGRFTAATIERLLGHFRRALTTLVADPSRPLSAVELVTEEERRRWLLEWNRTATDYDRHSCIHQLIERQAAETPQNIAVIYKDERLSYEELNRRANRIAHFLRRRGVGPEVLVGLLFERSLEMITGLLGVLKAGGAYLPLDLQYPPERLSFMMRDAGATLLLTEEALAEVVPEHGAGVVRLDADWPEIARESEENPRTEVTAHNLVYVIYTSGSTGRPKGVMIEHRELVNYLVWCRETFDPGAGHGSPIHAPIAFDGTKTSLFFPLTVGRSLVMIDEEAGVEGLVSALRGGEEFALVKITPAHLELLSLSLSEEEASRCARTLIVGGEALWGESLRFWCRHAPRTRLVQEYGPTETTVSSCWYDIPSDATLSGPVPIGRPIANTEVYVLDDRLRAVPPGVAGELYIGGEGLARGYMGRPGLTAEKFIPDPFGRRPGARLYRTGDLMRLLPDGLLEFLGRIDTQVKVRGFRIELGEIESALAQHAGTAGVVVVVREGEDGDKRLVAYVVAADQEQRPTVAELRQHLKTRLPEYMIPSAFVFMERLPVNANGKVDRRALPAPEQTQAEATRDFNAPRTPVEEMLAEVWKAVLRIEQVGREDHFFELGGHSLLATQVVSRVREAFNVEYTLRDLFAAPALAASAARVETRRKAGKGVPSVPDIERAPRGRDLRLSFAQQRMWILNQLEPDTSAYNIPVALRLRGELDLDALRRSLGEVVRRHEALRTAFVSVGGLPVQRVLEAKPLPLPLTDLTALGEGEREQECRRIADGEARQPFDLAGGEVVRARVVKLGAEEHVLLWGMHHIVADGWSLGVLVREVAALYGAFAEGAASPLAELEIQYGDYAEWQREWLRGEVLAEQLGYWRRQLEGTAALRLPTDRPRPAVQTSRGAVEHLSLSKELTGSLMKVGRQENGTLFMTLLAALKTLLHRYTGQNDICVGTVVANRNRPATEPLIGFFINNLALRTDFSHNPTFRELLGREREVTLDAYMHEDVPFEMVLENLQLERDLSRTPLFQVLFVLQNTPDASANLSKIRISPLGFESSTARFELEFYLSECPEGVGVSLVYNADLFEGSTIRRLLEHFRTLLVSLSAHPDERVASLQFMTEAELRQVVTGWNETRVERHERCFAEAFEAQVAKTPDSPAAQQGALTVSYRELNRRANRLAHVLMEEGVGPDTVVALLSERGIDLLVGILGVFKAGGAYLPLDPRHPPARHLQILRQSGSPLVLVAAEFVPTLRRAFAEGAAADLRARLLSIEDAQGRARIEGNPPVRSAASNLAYVIYTSGSTGTPKGAMVEHRGMYNHLCAKISDLRLSQGDVVAQTASQCFDISVWQLLSPLVVGGRVHIVPDETAQEPARLLDCLESERITVVETVPSLLRFMLEEVRRRERAERPALKALRWMVPTGEALPPEICRQWLDYYPAAPLLNAYGPTECSDDVTHYAMHEPPGGDVLNVPIGRPVENARLYVLDANLRPLPVKVPGELYVGGVCVGRGYMNDPAHTAQVFVPDPLAREVGARLYKTGDLARFLPGGEIEFLGRADYQVKIRGYRIELGEIEAALRAHERVREAVVVAREESGTVAGRTGLVAYVVAEAQSVLTVDELQSFVRERLPEYMVPQAFVLLAELPLTPNGKVDRKALPSPAAAPASAADTYAAPRNPTEERLAAICAEVLGVERVGIDDNFFRLGGHSLLATQAMSRLREAFQIEVPLRRIFEQPTVAGLALVVLEIQAEQAGNEEMAQLLAELDGLSDEEVQYLLDSEVS